MKPFTFKNKINVSSVIVMIVMLLLYSVSRLIQTGHLPLYSLYFIIAAVIYGVFIIFREFTCGKKTKYTTLISYLLVLSLLVLVILLFNQLAGISPSAVTLFYIGVFSFIIALIGAVVSLFFNHEWYKKKIRMWAHIFIALSVVITTINLIINYSWNNPEGNVLILIICVCMFNTLAEALIRSCRIKFLSFFERNYLLSGIISLLLIFVIAGF